METFSGVRLRQAALAGCEEFALHNVYFGAPERTDEYLFWGSKMRSLTSGFNADVHA